MLLASGDVYGENVLDGVAWSALREMAGVPSLRKDGKLST